MHSKNIIKKQLYFIITNMSALQQVLLKNCFSVRCLQFSSIIFNINPRTRHYCKQTSTTTTNPLLRIDKLPEYSKINGEIIEEALPILLDEADNSFTTFENELNSIGDYSWQNVVVKSDLLSDRLGLAWSAVSHLHGVKNNPELRNAYQQVSCYKMMKLIIEHICNV